VARYQAASGAEAESEPGSHGRVLKNLLGITRKRDMDRAEYEALFIAQEQELTAVTARTRFTAKHLCRMHRDWLGGIYAWAGRYRTVELSKDGFAWPPAFRVAENMAAFESGLLRASTPCSPGTVRDVAERIAVVHAEFLLIHPFREGNGRMARWLSALMAQQAGLPSPDYSFDKSGGRKRRAIYLEAVKRGYLTDYDLLTDFLVEAMGRRLGVADEAGFGKPRAPSKSDD
jgi:cell filamentation protein